jgi:hypothetical protein
LITSTTPRPTASTGVEASTDSPTSPGDHPAATGPEDLADPSTTARRPASPARRPASRIADRSPASPADRQVGPTLRRRRAARRWVPAHPGRQVLLGLLWAFLLVAAADAGPLALAVVMVPVGLTAALSGVRAASAGLPSGSLRLGGTVLSPILVVAAVPAVVLPVAALGGPVAAVVVGLLLVAGAGAVLVTSGFITSAPGDDLVASGPGHPYAVLPAAFLPAIATASVVLARGQGLSEALTLLAAVCLYDTASFMTGTSPRGGLVGVFVGMVTVGVLAVFVAAVVVPPFSGRSPLLLGLVAVLAPAGVFAAARLTRNLRLPALRRLDSLVLAGPAWVIGVALVLHR